MEELQAMLIKWTNWAIGLALGLAIREWFASLVDLIIPQEKISLGQGTEKGEEFVKQTALMIGTLIIMGGVILIWTKITG